MAVETGIEFVRLANTFEAFGMAMDLLSRHRPFRAFALGQTGTVLRLQLRQRQHVAAVRGRELVGYLGWMPTSVEVGEAWMAGTGELTAVPPESADAVALTIVVAPLPGLATAMIRIGRPEHGGRRVYFKRGEAELERKGSLVVQGRAPG